MSSSFASLFSKKTICPSSETLLAYHQSGLAFKRTRLVKGHLPNCDFCSAELQLLTRHYRQGDEYLFAEMPAQLRKLAERWLKRSVAPLKLINPAA